MAFRRRGGAPAEPRVPGAKRRLETPPPLTLAPSTWAARQQAFRAEFAADAAAPSTITVHWRVTEPGGVGRMARNRVRPTVSLWPEDAEPGEQARLVFEVAEMPSLAGGHCVVHGEAEINGALCLVLDDGSVVWPTYNPRVPAYRPEHR